MLSRSLVATAVRHHQGTSTDSDQAALDAVRLRRLEGGRNNGVYRITYDGLPLCLKIYRIDGRQRGRREWDTLQFLMEYDIDFVPKAVQFANVDEVDVVVMQFIDGSHLGYRSLDKDQLDALVSHTLRLQGLPYDIRRIPRVVSVTERLEAIRSFLTQATAPDSLTASCLRMMERWTHGTDPAVLLQPTFYVFSRMDTSLANAIWDVRQLTLIDFEYSGWTEPACDIAELIEHVQSRGTADELWEHFVRYLDPSPRVMEQLLPARRLIALEWVRKFWSDGRSSPSRELKKQINRAFHLCEN